MSRYSALLRPQGVRGLKVPFSEFALYGKKWSRIDFTSKSREMHFLAILNLGHFQLNLQSATF